MKVARFALALLIAAPAFGASLQSIQKRDFPELSRIERTPAIARIVAADPDLAKIFAAKRAASDVESLRFTDDEIARAAAALRTIDAGWPDEARAINRIIDVYALGKPPRYPAIDSISFDPKGEEFTRLLHTTFGLLHEETASMHLFFEPSLRFAMHLLEINGRDEAARFEPLARTLNAAALQHFKSIDWKKYPYTAILVPGYGPERPFLPLSPEGRLRLELAARRFHEGKAPLILVSGGFVHPNQTPYCEAVEMKRVLIDDFGVPADAVIAEPYARHTTTNLRNAARLMFAYGIPTDRAALVTTDTDQSDDIASDSFAQRCRDELGYVPMTIGRRTSPFDVEFTPRKSLKIDPMDPLDP